MGILEHVSKAKVGSQPWVVKQNVRGILMFFFFFTNILFFAVFVIKKTIIFFEYVIDI